MAGTILKQQADDHIREIRRRKGVDDPEGQDSENMRDLDQALNLLSDQLYEKETHFLLELIQNADDNTYDDDTPTISFRLIKSGNSWHMLIQCNEVGFEKDNVTALCRIGDSTKKSIDRTKGFIGEKGIGFKSVFKVANVVHISSKAYSFRLDRREKLGMIAPILEVYPFPQMAGGQARTQMLLELNGESEFDAISKELQKLEPQILIFLRKISKLAIRTPNLNVEFKIRRIVEDQDLDGKETAILTSSFLHDRREKSKKYLIVRHNETSLPNEERRANVNQTEVVLAFPIDENKQPSLRMQHTYSYLPINDYGFNYLIQGDFILVANRESVDSSKWNVSILEGVYRAFVSKAVPRFNGIRGESLTFQGLRYTWPLYLQDRGGTNEFWSRLKQWIFRRLAREHVLESRQNNGLSCPKDLLYIPPKFRLGGIPLVEDENSALCHLSFLYDSDIHNIMRILGKMGVRTMGIHEFSNELKSLIHMLGNSFLESQSRRWHSKVADIYLHSSRSHVAHIPLIPLRDGRWVTPSHNHVFLEGDASDALVPGWIDICLVDAEACRDAKRKALFEWLGIKKCDQTEVCRMIVESYSPFRPRSLEDSINDLLYLFQSPPNFYNISVDILQVRAAPPFDQDFKYTKHVYIEYPDQESIIKKYSEDPASNMPLLHPNYIKKACELGRERDFVTWLCSSLNISTQPCLVNDRQLLTPEFNFLKARAPKDLLLLLRDYWGRYASQLECPPTGSVLVTAITEMNVTCVDGLLRRLDQTVLPLETLKSAGPNLPFIDIPEPNDPRWLKFSTFGVLTHCSAELYLRELITLASLPVNDRTTKFAVQGVYAGLQSSIVQDSSMIRFEFEHRRLVFLAELKRWISLPECVWSGPELSTVYNLRSEYPQCRKLFQTYLRVENVNVDHVVRELQHATTETPFDRLKKLLLLLNKYLNLGVPGDFMSKLHGKKVFPVRKTDGNLYGLTYDQDTWYLADRQSLWDSFSGKLPLIDFDVKTVRTLNPLIKAIGMTLHLLSEADVSKLEKVGSPVYDEMKTTDLSGRAVHFLLLIPEETPEIKAQLLHRLRTLKVWGVPTIKITHEVDGVLGTEEKGNVVFDDADDSKLDIYISFTDSQKAIIDFQLSQQFIRHCGIADHGFQKLVAPILTYPRSEIEKFLESYGLSELDNRPDMSADLSTSDLEENDESNDSLVRNAADTVTMPRTPSSDRNPGRDIADPESNFEVSEFSLLRERIPTLDESISAIRIAAAMPNTTPTLVATLSQSQINPTQSTPGTGSNTQDLRCPEAQNELPSVEIGTNQATLSTPSVPPTSEHRMEVSHDALNSGYLHSTFSKGFQTGTPYQTSDYAPRFSRSSCTFGMDSHPENTSQGIHFQHTGLLGEIFVNYWLSRELKNDWDATRHWTSRNRNYIYADHPFRGSEKGFSDFTYPDTNGSLTHLLVKYGIIRNVEIWFTKPPKYHLEVKSTTGPCREAFYMSNNQVNKARDYTISWAGVPENVYVIVKVYNIDQGITPGFTAYIDPWAMYLKRELDFSTTDEYAVMRSVNL